MRAYLLIALALTACYGRDDAAKQAVKAGAQAPVKCVLNSGGWNTDAHYQDESYICADAAHRVWVCSEDDGCVNMGRNDR